MSWSHPYHVYIYTHTHTVSGAYFKDLTFLPPPLRRPKGQTACELGKAFMITYKVYVLSKFSHSPCFIVHNPIPYSKQVLLPPSPPPPPLFAIFSSRSSFLESTKVDAEVMIDVDEPVLDGYIMKFNSQEVILDSRTDEELLKTSEEVCWKFWGSLTRLSVCTPNSMLSLSPS